MIVRYTSAAIDSVEYTAPGSVANSPLSVPRITRTTVPAAICIAVFMIGSRGRLGSVRREQRAERPQDRRQQGEDDAGRIERAVAAGDGRGDEEPDPGEADEDAEDGQGRLALAEQDGAEDRHPDRHQGDDEGDDPGRHRLRGPRDAAHPAAEQEGADDAGVADLAARDPESGATASKGDPAEHDRPGDPEPEGRHEERRQRVDRDGDREVGRAPDDVQDEHPERDRTARSAGSAQRGSGWHIVLVQDASIRPRGPEWSGSGDHGPRVRPALAARPVSGADGRPSDRNGTRCSGVIRLALWHVGRHTMWVVSEPR